MKVRARLFAHVALVWFVLSVLAASALGTVLNWQASPNGRWADLPVSKSGRAGFVAPGAAATGVRFTNTLAEARSLTNRVLLSGSGVAAGDVDGDGWCDLYFCHLDGDNVLFRNLGNWKFEDITARAGVACPNLDSTAATFADLDGDGDLDLLVNSLGGGVKMFENDGHGVFKEVTREAGVTSKSGGMSLALADLDGNGTLDLYAVNYRPTTLMDRPTTRFRIETVNGIMRVAQVDGQPATSPELTNRFVLAPSGQVMELGEPDSLFLNDGKGRFTPVSFTSGAFLDEDGKPLPDAPRDWGLAAQIRDINGDGTPDIYVCNDLFSPDRVWLGEGRGKFRALPRLALRNTSTFSMGIDFADVNRDGHLDFFVTDMLSRDPTRRHVQVAESTPIRWPVGVFEDRPQVHRNTLQLNRGDGTFAEVSYYAGLEASEWSWGPVFLDVDLDGYEDLLIPNGQHGDFQNADMARRVNELRASQRLSPQEVVQLVKLYPRLDTPNFVFRNRGDCTFEDASAAWGFNAAGISQGLCLADLDNDGDLDVVLNNLNAEAGIYRNDTAAPRLTVRLKGLPPNTRGIGAQIKVLNGPASAQSQEMICGGRYLSGDDTLRVFAAGSMSSNLTIEVSWRSGKKSVVQNARANRVYEIDEAGASDSSPAPAPTKPLFEDASSLLQHAHAEEPFDDFARQPLLPRRLSQLGPSVAWFDVNGDGHDDLLVGSGRGGPLRLLLNDGPGRFKRASGIWAQAVERDQTSVLGLARGQVLAGTSNYEDGTSGSPVVLYDAAQRTVREVAPGSESSPGPLALADIDGDDDLDLFLGGRTVPGRYPEPASSFLFSNEGGRFILGQKLEKLGLVSGAVFSDLNNDGRPELILACEWGPIRVFRAEGGGFLEITRTLGLDKFTGWWNGVATGDFDGDGRLDIVASNWGLNTRYRASHEHPLRIYFGDMDGDGTVEIIESRYEESLKKYVPDRGLRAVMAALPFVQEQVASFEAYGRAGVEEIYGERVKSLSVLEVNTLASMAWLNRGGHFEPVLLPKEAQFAPALGVCVADADGDGHEDVFLSQNFFAVNPDAARCDAGRGLWLRGDGKGGLQAFSSRASDVEVYGEQRGAACGDFDEDGRVDLVVSQNGAATRLFRNVNARPGLRVRVRGPAGNPNAVGAKLQLLSGNVTGPVREVQAGSGYWGQNSAVQVLGSPQTATRLRVQWPGGKTALLELPADVREIEISEPNVLRKLK